MWGASWYIVWIGFDFYKRGGYVKLAPMVWGVIFLRGNENLLDVQKLIDFFFHFLG